MSLLSRGLYGEVDPKIRDHIKECIICFEEFKPDQSIIQLKCNERHFFHTPLLRALAEIEVGVPSLQIPNLTYYVPCDSFIHLQLTWC
jgi:hypothetical protein